jgi:cytidylate kinase
LRKIKIAIDGPAGAGKSSISRALAQKLKFFYIDTGAMYRAVGLAALKNGIDSADEISVARLISETKIDMLKIGDEYQILLNGCDKTCEIRVPEVSMYASNVSKFPVVREKLVALARNLAAGKNVIMDGRDVGTYIFPRADIKIFLTASLAERAKRRFDELLERGVLTDLETVTDDMRCRDENDQKRKFSPLFPAADAIIVNTTGNSLEKSIEMVFAMISSRLNQ